MCSTGAGNLESAARKCLSGLGEILERATDVEHRAVATVCADAEAGRFPQILKHFFARESRTCEQRYVVDGLRKVGRRTTVAVPRITFETDPMATHDIVTWGNGIVWAANLWVGGVVVPETEVVRYLDVDLREVEEVAKNEAEVSMAYRFDADLTHLDVCVFDSAPELRFRLAGV